MRKIPNLSYINKRFKILFLLKRVKRWTLRWTFLSFRFEYDSYDTYDTLPYDISMRAPQKPYPIASTTAHIFWAGRFADLLWFERYEIIA